MLLAIDVGNSNTVMGLFQLSTEGAPASVVADWRITTPHKQTPDELGVLLQTLFAMRNVKMEDVHGLSSRVSRPVCRCLPIIPARLEQTAL
jgi:type III pantothenate kinase